MKIHNIYINSLKNICPCCIGLRGQYVAKIPKFFSIKCIWKSLDFTGKDLVKVWVILDYSFEKEFFTKLFKSMIIRSHYTGEKIDLTISKNLYNFIEELINDFLVIKNDKNLYNEHQLFQHYQNYYNKISPIYKISYDAFIENINPIYDYNTKDNYNVNDCKFFKNNVVFVPTMAVLKTYISKIFKFDLTI